MGRTSSPRRRWRGFLTQQIHGERKPDNWNTYALVATIELARGTAKNPEVPEWLKEEYFSAIQDLAKLGATEILRAKTPKLLEPFSASLHWPRVLGLTHDSCWNTPKTICTATNNAILQPSSIRSPRQRGPLVLMATVTFLNQGWLDYTGMTAEQAQGWGWAQTIHPEARVHKAHQHRVGDESEVSMAAPGLGTLLCSNCLLRLRLWTIGRLLPRNPIERD